MSDPVMSEVRRYPAVQSVDRLRDLLETTLAGVEPGHVADTVMSALDELDDLSVEIDRLFPFPLSPISRWKRIKGAIKDYLLA